MHDLINKNSSRLEVCMRLLDVLALDIGGELAARLYFQSSLREAAPVHTVVLYLCCSVAFFLFPRLDVYAPRRGRVLTDLLLRLAAAWSLVLLIGIVFGFLNPHIGTLSRGWMADWFLCGLLLLLASRAIAYRTLSYLRRKGMNSKRVLIVGYGTIGREMHRRAAQQSWFGYEVKAILGETAEAPAPATASAATPAEAAAPCEPNEPGVTRLATLAEIPACVSGQAIDEIWITLPIGASVQLREVQFLLRNALVDIRWMPDTASMQILSSHVGDFLGFPAVDLNRPRSSDLRGIVKELFDKVFALAALTLLAPLFAVLAVCIKRASPGPVFFRQQRLGLNGKPFTVYKFRSMQVQRDGPLLAQATRDDPRVMKLGRFLRRTSLDELPQFINVLLGDMSVVGPRPHALQHNEMYKDLLASYMLRHRVKPGITGWAQIHGYRGETDTLDKMADRVRFDLHYIQHWSLAMDLRIIVWTAFKGWTHQHAY